jgi:AbrB family looped-hinge helix DNA binding protein
MKHDVVPIDQAGRIVLPKRVRQELAIQSGDTFTVAISGMAVTLTPNKAGSGFARQGRALVLATAGDERLRVESVQALLDADRTDHDSHAVAGLVKQGFRG